MIQGEAVAFTVTVVLYVYYTVELRKFREVQIILTVDPGEFPLYVLCMHVMYVKNCLP